MPNAIISGASSGIGLAISQRLLQQGWQVLGLARDFSKAAILCEHASFSFQQIDFSQMQQLPQQLKALVKSQDTIDAVIFAAGQGMFGSLEEYSAAQIQHLMDVNFTSQALLARAVIPTMKRAGRGNLVFIGSEAALQGSRKGSVYCASKFALRGFAQALRDECASNGVHVSIVNPGMVLTPFFDSLNFAPGTEDHQALLPEDVADVITSLLNSRKGAVIDEINLSPAVKTIRFK